MPLQLRARTRDFQEVSVQLTVTFRVTDPSLAARRLDFSIDLMSGRWRATPLEQLGSALSELAQQHALDLIARTPLAVALVDGVGKYARGPTGRRSSGAPSRWRASAPSPRTSWPTRSSWPPARRRW